MGRRGVWLLIAVVLGLAFIVFVYPQIRAIRLQSKAGKLIEEHVAKAQLKSAEAGEGVFYCLVPTFHPEIVDGEELDQAITWLNEARSLAPKNVHSSFLLGQAYCLKGDYEQAVDALEEFLTRRPDNQLARAEVGFAYTALARSATDPQIAQTYQSRSLQYLEQAGFSEKSFVDLGNAAFKQERHQDALVWYQFVSGVRMPTDLDNYRLSLLETIYLGHSAHTEYLPMGLVTKLDNRTTIEPDGFFYIIDGSPVSVSQTNQKPISILWSKSTDIGVIVVANESGTYCVELEALDKEPEPTELELRLDFNPILKFVLTEGDGNWKVINTEATLEQGAHLISIELLNDYRVEGVVDRNGYIGILTIKICE